MKDHPEHTDQSVKLTLNTVQKDERDTSVASQVTSIKSIEAAAKKEVREYVDFTIAVTVNGSDAGALTATANMIELTIPFDFDGKKDVQIFRHHNGSSATMRPVRRNSSTEGYYLDRSANKIYVYANQFSLYAIGYNLGTESTGTSSGGGGGSYTPTVIPKIVPEVPTVIFNKPGESLTDKVVVTGLADQTVTFASADPKIATVDKNGKITAVAPGSTTITVTGSDGKTKATIKVTVKEEEKTDEETKAKDDDNTSDIDNQNISSVKTSDFGKLRARITKTTKHTLKLQWTKQSGADGYIIYGNYCNHAGETYKLEKIKTVKSNKNSITFKNLEKATYYKYVVHAYKNVGGKKVIIAKSVVVHGTTTGGKYGLASAVKINKIGTKTYDTTKPVKLTLKKGKNIKVQAEEVFTDKKAANHRALTLESSNTKVVKITKSGKIKAVGKGTAKVWVYAQNGVYTTITVTVK